MSWLLILFTSFLGLFIFLYILTKPKRRKQHLDHPKVVQIDSKEKNRSKIYRHFLSKDGLLTESSFKGYPSGKTLYESFMEAVEKRPSNDCLGTRMNDGGYNWITYKDLEQRATLFGSGLLQIGAKSKELIGIFSGNNEEWTVSDRALIMYSMTSVPLYQTLGQEAVDHILNICEIKIIISTPKHIPTLLATKSKFLKTIVVIGDDFKDLEVKTNDTDVKLMKFSDMYHLGKINVMKHIPPSKDDICTISFTSGTTGVPKGVMLSHGNIMTAIKPVLIEMNYGEDVHISYLPMAHVMERILQTVMFHHAGKIGFFRGDPTKLLDDVMCLKPTIFASVPRVYNKIYDAVTSQIEKKGGLTKKLFDFAYNTKLEMLKDGYQPCIHSFWDYLVFSKIKERLGGKVRYLITGSAPISKETMNFLRICFSCPIIEAYGQTETAGIATLSQIDDASVGNVGPPSVNNEICLEDVPEMNYFHNDKNPCGEILVRSAEPFKGYYKEPEKTKETIDQNGWVHTGDIGTILPNGSLKIIDRKKNIFKLSQGEYIAPEKIENICVQMPIIQAIWVTGDSFHSYVIAFVVPFPDAFLSKAKEMGKEENLEKLCKDAEMNEIVLKEMEEFGKSKGLNKLEIPKIIYLEPDMWTPESDLLTPTMKTKRPSFQKYYQNIIDRIYK
eukprot:gene1659-429_t